MRGTVSKDEAITAIGGLTIRQIAGPGDPVDEPGQARRDVARLRAAADAYVASRQCDHAAGICALGTIPGGQAACDLATEVAQSGVVPRAGGPRPAATRWLEALRDSCRAVWLCRRIAHPAGQCWFEPSGNDPEHATALCGRILGVTHRLG